ncbi:uncharacterized protein EDB91DRAFT_1105406 [Suillus paluster]|uniref:uncharacterized protein n=1 Tax=Suillus paluster TaxID=48578 RepID=UPI001B8678BC|nr:uncharacterized protein EDB91DRAFT_1105406 [Suillus paluster]KAG1751417.1 hypothetical protein EDB91DRAFT_1105406 [Suillus paluster]
MGHLTMNRTNCSVVHLLCVYLGTCCDITVSGEHVSVSFFTQPGCVRLLRVRTSYFHHCHRSRSCCLLRRLLATATLLGVCEG